jgi:hypothetical protein
LVHGDKDPSQSLPERGYAVAVVLDLEQWESAKSRRQWISAPIVGDPQRTLEGDGKTPTDADALLLDSYFEHYHPPRCASIYKKFFNA